MLTDRACFILGERAECNTRRCVSKNVTKKLSKCQSGIQLGCWVGSWEAIPKALQAFRQAEWDVSTCDWDTHSQFGFWERAYSRISVPGGHVRQRAGAHFGKRPEGADKTVLGNADQARRNLEGEGATKLCAGRLGTIVEKTADDSTGLMQSNTDGGLQLEQVWSEYYQKVFHNAHWGRKAGDRGQEAGKNHVLVYTIPTTNFKFLDICNYLGPSTSYERWVKMYGSSQTKSWLPYEWLDCADKLDYDGLSLNRCWFSKLKNEFVLLLEEYEDCQQVFREQGMRTFDCWLEYYNNLDVSPFPEAQEKRKGFYSGLCVDIFEDAVSLLGVSLQYLLRGMLQGRNLSELYAPEKEAYEMLKGAVVGGPSLVFTRKHEVRKTTTAPPHKSRTTRVRVKRLFVMTLTHCTGVLFWKKCLVGQERWLITKIQPKLGGFKSRLHRKVWFGSAEVDIHVPRELWTKFEEFPPLFYNSYIPSKAIATHMKEYLQWTKRAGIQTEKLCERLTGKKILLYAPLLESYLKHGVEITDWTTDHRPPKILTWFINEVTENRCRGGEDPDIAFLADVLKLLGNSAYGKLMKAKERQTRVIYTKDQHVVNQAKWSAWFDDLEEIGDVFKIVLKGESDDQQAVPGGNHRVSTGQLAKLRMLQFYYDCLDHFIDRRDFKLIQMDTDSTYLMQNARRSRLPRGSWRVPSDKNALVRMGQMEQLHTVSVG